MGSADGGHILLRDSWGGWRPRWGRGPQRKTDQLCGKETKKADDREGVGWGRGDLFRLDGVGSFKEGI